MDRYRRRGDQSLGAETTWLVRLNEVFVLSVKILLLKIGRCGFFPVDPADYVDAYRGRKKSENRLRYPEKTVEEEPAPTE